MKLYTLHKILIASVLVMSVVLLVWSIKTRAWPTAALACVALPVLAAYFVYVRRRFTK
jgi:hypothetical protein